MNTSTELEKAIESIRGKIRMYSEIVDDECHVIEHCPYIVEVGPLTVGTDVTGKTILELTTKPEQFSKASVETIRKMTFRDSDGNVVPAVVYDRKDWHRKELAEFQNTLNQLLKLRCNDDN